MIEIDTQSAIPVYEQIIRQIQTAIRAGDLKPGEPLPPIRQLAQDLELTPTTIAKAYMLLEKAQIIRTGGRRGTFVHEEAGSNIRQSVHRDAERELKGLLDRWRSQGLEWKEIRAMIERQSSEFQRKEKS